MNNKNNRFFALLLIFLFSATITLSGDPFTVDTDHDGFPDDLEQATGYNPRINDALTKSSRGGKCGKISTDPSTIANPQNVLIILDVSGSMSASLGKSTRMNIAKKIMTKYIKSLPSSMRIGFVIYGKTGCDDNSVELIAPIGKNNKKTIISKLNDLSPSGGTPIAFTLKKSIEYFKGFERDNNSLILISDGQEGCGGNPIQAIHDLKKSPANPDVTVFGLGVDSRTRKQLSEIAKTSGGAYSDINSEEDFIKALGKFFKRLNKFYKDIVCIIRQYNKFLAYETQQFNKSKNYLLNKKVMAKGSLKQKMIEVEDQITKNHKEREAAKDKLEIMIKNKMKEMKEATEAFLKSF